MARKTLDYDPDEMRDEEPAPAKPAEPARLTDADIAQTMHELNVEYRELASDPSGAALGRRAEIRGLLRKYRILKASREEMVRVQVPFTIHPIQLGTRVFHPGAHEVPASVAQDLVWIIDQQQRAEIRRMTQNGVTIDLSDPSSRVRAIAEMER